MKKFASTALAMTMLASVSCGGGGISGETTNDSQLSGDTTTVAAVKTRLDELGEKDFNGKTLTILDTGEIGMHTNRHVGEENGDVLNDAIYKRDKFIEDTYGAKIEYYHPTEGGATQFLNSVLADDRAYDLIISVINNSVGTLAKQGALANLCAFDELTLDAEWWSPLVYENCRIGDVMYYTTGDFAPSIYCAPGCLFMNKKLADDYSISMDEVYTKVTDGKWTFDALHGYSKDLTKDLNGDDTLTIEDDFFGIANAKGGLAACVFTVGAGGTLSNSGSDDLYLALDNEQMNNIIEKVSSVVGKTWPKEDANFHEMFKGDRALFFMHYVSSAYTRYRDMESDYAILPIPKYDEAQETYRSLVNSWCNSFVGVAKNVTDEHIPFLMEAMAWYSHEYIRPASYENAFQSKGARDERDAEMLDIIFDTLCLDLNFIEDFGGTTAALSSAIFEDASFSTKWASIEPSVKSAIESFTTAWLDGAN